MFGNPSLKEVWGETFYNIIILWKLTNFKEDRKFLLDKRLHSTLHLLRWNPRNDRVVCISSSSKNSIKSQCKYFENSFSFVIFFMQKLCEINVFHLPKELPNDYNEVERIGEDLRSILRVNDFTTKPRPPTSIILFWFRRRILRSFLVISSMWRPFSILKPMPTFSRKKSPFSVSSVLPTIISSLFWLYKGQFFEICAFDNSIYFLFD